MNEDMEERLEERLEETTRELSPEQKKLARLMGWLGVMRCKSHEIKYLKWYIFLADVLFDEFEKFRIDKTGYGYAIWGNTISIYRSRGESFYRPVDLLEEMSYCGVIKCVFANADQVELIRELRHYYNVGGDYRLKKVIRLIENGFDFEKVAPWGIQFETRRRITIEPETFAEYRKEFRESIELFEVMCV